MTIFFIVMMSRVETSSFHNAQNDQSVIIQNNSFNLTSKWILEEKIEKLTVTPDH